MGTSYTVRSGDTLIRIARQNGYDSWEEIYYHDDNRSFRDRRPDPNRIYPGDVLILPDRPGTPAPPTQPPRPVPPPPRGRGGGGSGPPIPGVGPRRTPPGGSRTTLSRRYEPREIVVAQGIEHLNVNPWMRPGTDPGQGAPPHGYRIPRGLERHFPNNTEHEWESIDDSSATFVSHTQRVRFRVRVINTKDEYKRALETQELHVVYMGHSRYGRGQCFGPLPEPGDDWEQGSDTNTRGLLRTGYGVIGVHLSEMRNHGYRFYPVAGSVQLRSGWLHPHVPRSSLRRVALPTDLESNVLPVGQPVQDRYWGFRDGEGNGLLLWAGWEDTISDPMDLGASTLRCRCLCLFSCSTRTHYWRIVRRRKNWRRTDTEGFAYFTNGVSYPLTAWAWLRAVFEYSRRNDYESWYPSLEWARVRCTAILGEEGYRYGIF